MHGATQKGGGRGSSAGGEDAHSQPFAKRSLLLGIIRGKIFAILLMSSITEWLVI
jgi:hypothetical protein